MSLGSNSELSLSRRMQVVAAMLLAGCGSEGPTHPAPPDHLVFVVQPSAAAPGRPMTPAVQVVLVDASARTVFTATDAVSAVLGTNGHHGTLAGTTTVNAVRGVASFGDLQIDSLGSGYTLSVSAGALTGATSVPFPVVRPYTSVTTGGNGSFPYGFACGLMTTGAAYCWGYNGEGELGGGTPPGPPQCGSVPCSTTPMAVTGGLTFGALSAGGNFTCGITTSGDGYCWGDNTAGQLGDGTGTSSPTPVAVSGGLSFATISAGLTHACGLTMTGAVYCWGSNGDGQLGDSTTTSRTAPVAVAGGRTFTAVSAGRSFTCGVTTSGAGYCWGSAAQLGNGTTTGPQQCGYDPCSTTPLPIAGALTLKAVSAGGLHACGVTTSGTGYCWGANGFGQLGDSTGTYRGTPVPVAGYTFSAVNAGLTFTCGVTLEAAAYCWGVDEYGQLGDGRGGNVYSFTPVQVLGGISFAEVRPGQYSFTCGVTTTNVAYCWGFNVHGELGNGTVNLGSRAPVPVP
jgi:alpha-tubulin suppressor-like RCC1 family protein